MNFYEVVNGRRSVRAYRRDQVPEEKLNRILQAAAQAPSAANRQPVRFHVVRDVDLKKKLIQAYPQQWFVDAPAVVCACSVPGEAWKRGDGKNYADIDATIAMDHLMLAATNEGLGTCWIGAFNVEALREALGLPAELEPIALTPLGYPAEAPKATPRKSPGEIVQWR